MPPNTPNEPPTVPAAAPVPLAPAPPSPAPAPAATSAAAPAEKTFTQDELNRLVGEARKEGRAKLLGSLKDFGVQDEAALEAMVKAAHDSKLAQMSELEKANTRLKELEAKHAAEVAARTNAEKAVARVRLFAASGVIDMDVAGFLLDKAVAEGATDEKAALAKLKTERPYLFGGGAPAPTAPPQPGVPATTGQAPQQPPAPSGASTSFNAMTASRDDLLARARAAGIDPRLVGL